VKEWVLWKVGSMRFRSLQEDDREIGDTSLPDVHADPFVDTHEASADVGYAASDDAPPPEDPEGDGGRRLEAM
jgi:hypothetical protein